jgi:hypothetical protein
MARRSPQHFALRAESSALADFRASYPKIMAVRTFADGASSGGDKGKAASSSSSSKAPPDEDTTNELVLTPGEKVVAATRLTMWAGIAVFAGVCAYYIGKELLPTYVLVAIT